MTSLFAELQLLKFFENNYIAEAVWEIWGSWKFRHTARREVWHLAAWGVVHAGFRAVHIWCLVPQAPGKRWLPHSSAGLCRVVFFSLGLHGQLHISWLFLPLLSLFPNRFLESYLSPFLHKPFVGLCQLQKWRQPRRKISTKIQAATESSPGLWPHEWRTSPRVSRYSIEAQIPCKYKKSTSDLFDYKRILKYNKEPVPQSRLNTCEV